MGKNSSHRKLFAKLIKDVADENTRKMALEVFDVAYKAGYTDAKKLNQKKKEVRNNG